MVTGSHIGLTNRIVRRRGASCTFKVQFEIEGRLRRRYPEPQHEIATVGGAAPSQAPVQKYQTLLLRMLQIIERHGESTSLT